MNLAVSAPFRRQGIAARLVCSALRMGLDHKASRAMLEVRASNQEALALYRGLGFRETARRIRYYTNPDEDAVLMDMVPLRLGPACEPPVGRPHEPGNKSMYGHV